MKTYLNNAKKMLRDYRAGKSYAIDFLKKYHPEPGKETCVLADFLLAIARKYHCKNWPSFCACQTSLRQLRAERLMDTLRSSFGISDQAISYGDQILSPKVFPEIHRSEFPLTLYSTRFSEVLASCGLDRQSPVVAAPELELKYWVEADFFKYNLHLTGNPFEQLEGKEVIQHYLTEDAAKTLGTMLLFSGHAILDHAEVASCRIRQTRPFNTNACHFFFQIKLKPNKGMRRDRWEWSIAISESVYKQLATNKHIILGSLIKNRMTMTMEVPIHHKIVPLLLEVDQLTEVNGRPIPSGCRDYLTIDIELPKDFPVEAYRFAIENHAIMQTAVELTSEKRALKECRNALKNKRLVQKGFDAETRHALQRLHEMWDYRQKGAV